MYRFMVSLVAVLSLAVVWGPGPAGANSAEYQRALAEYNFATGLVNQAQTYVDHTQAELAQAQAKVAQAQAAYNQADAQYQQIQGKVEAVDRKIDSLKQQMNQNLARLENLSMWHPIENRRILAESDRLSAELTRAWATKDNLIGSRSYWLMLRNDAQGALEDAKSELEAFRNKAQGAQAALAQAKQRQAAALRALNRIRAQQSVSYSPQYGAGFGDSPYWLIQIQQRWWQIRIPGSRLGTAYHY